jgi:hypothetical protein
MKNAISSRGDIPSMLTTTITSFVEESTEFDQIVSGLPRNHSENNQRELKKQIDFVKINLDVVRNLAKKEGLHHLFRATFWSVLLVLTTHNKHNTYSLTFCLFFTNNLKICCLGSSTSLFIHTQCCHSREKWILFETLRKILQMLQ